MVYNRFAAGVALQSVFVGLLGAIFFWTLTQDYLLVAKLSFAVIWISSISGMIFYVNRTNRGLTNFLQTVKTLDSSRPLSSDKKSSFHLLNITYNDIIDSIQEVKISKEVDYQYFRSLIENVGTGIIAFDQEGKIETINRSARKILDFGDPVNIKDMDKRIEGFSALLLDMKPNINSLNKVILENEMISLSIRKVLFMNQSRQINLVSLQNIRNELEEEEIEVWQKLIHVLTHEIMNSVSPIKSLTGTLISKAGTIAESESTDESQNGKDIVAGLKAIETRSRGLLRFVDSYRNLSRIPSPVYSEILIKKFLEDFVILIREDIAGSRVELELMKIAEDLVFFADEKLITQVMINLVSNANYALTGIAGGLIEIGAYKDDDERKIIYVKDNGKGIPPDIIDKIFIPFYTTREDGSGIGLSLSRQILHLHNATISVSSKPGSGTCFSLTFP